MEERESEGRVRRFGGERKVKEGLLPPAVDQKGFLTMRDFSLPTVERDLYVYVKSMIKCCYICFGVLKELSGVVSNDTV